jgi:hypothetical protein
MQRKLNVSGNLLAGLSRDFHLRVATVHQQIVGTSDKHHLMAGTRGRNHGSRWKLNAYPLFRLEVKKPHIVEPDAQSRDKYTKSYYQTDASNAFRCSSPFGLANRFVESAKHDLNNGVS